MSENVKSYESATVKPLDGSRVEITGSVSAETWGKHRAKAIQEINKSIKMDGFRKGMVSESVLIAKVGEMPILEEMAELALSKAYVDIIIDNKVDAIGKPTIQVTKLAAGNPLEFKIVTAIVPAISLPDYKDIAKKQIAKQNPDERKFTEKDVDDTIMRIRKSRVSHDHHDHGKLTHEEHEKLIEAALPAVTDDFVRSLGDFADVADFKTKVTAMVAEEKADSFREKTRIRIADALTEATKIDLPAIMLESELDRTETQFKADIERMGLKLEDYLKHAKKTIEDLRQEWKPAAEKKAKIQLVINAIAQAENIKPDPKEVEAEVDHIVAHYAEADRERAAAYAETVLTNEKVFKFLEGVK